jgi:hypothetical protein
MIANLKDSVDSLDMQSRSRFRDNYQLVPVHGLAKNASCLAATNLYFFFALP